MQTFDLAIQSVQALGSIATAALVLLTWQQVKQLRKQVRLAQEQATTSIEDHLTEQYRGLMEHIPIDVWLGAELKALAADAGRQSRCRDAIYRYIDLSQEQAFLHCKGRVTNETWVEWSSGIKTNMGLPAFKEVWEQVGKKWPESFRELRAVFA